DLLRILHRQRPEEECVHHAEDRRIRPDSQRQRERTHNREARILREHPNGVLDILENRFHHSLPEIFSMSHSRFGDAHVIRIAAPQADPLAWLAAPVCSKPEARRKRESARPRQMSADPSRSLRTASCPSGGGARTPPQVRSKPQSEPD